MRGLGSSERPWLMLVTDRSLTPAAELPAAVEAAVAGGVDAVQLREKGLPAGELYRLGLQLRAVTARQGALLLVNDRLDVALAVGADGVHLGETALPVAAARAVAGGRLLIGRSVHGVEAALAAARAGADYLVVGTVFPSRSHPGGPVGGLELVRAVAAAVRVPVLGIGGITVANAAAVVQAGAAGVAVISAVLGAPDPAAAAAELRRALAGSRAAEETGRWEGRR